MADDPHVGEDAHHRCQAMRQRDDADHFSLSGGAGARDRAVCVCPQRAAARRSRVQRQDVERGEKLRLDLVGIKQQVLKVAAVANAVVGHAGPTSGPVPWAVRPGV